MQIGDKIKYNGSSETINTILNTTDVYTIVEIMHSWGDSRRMFVLDGFNTSPDHYYSFCETVFVTTEIDYFAITRSLSY